jgi:hypothetical protein
MPIRTHQQGDELAQVQIYNSAAGPLPGFKPATAEEVARRHQAAGGELIERLYAVDDGRVVGYIVWSPNGRISYPWCLPGAEVWRPILLEAALSEMSRRGDLQAWAAYRRDWLPVLTFFNEHGFTRARTMVNYVAELGQIPDLAPQPGQLIAPFKREDLPGLVTLGGDLFANADERLLAGFFWENAYFGPDVLFALKDVEDDRLLGVALCVVNSSYADPTRIDAAMPCFRLGAFGTESERHKRVNGMFACAFVDESAGELLLAEAARRLRYSGDSHIAAQAPSDAHALCVFYDRVFSRQGEFPILVRSLSS